LGVPLFARLMRGVFFITSFLVIASKLKAGRGTVSAYVVRIMGGAAGSFSQAFRRNQLANPGANH
jgi:hypothetical protein